MGVGVTEGAVGGWGYLCGGAGDDVVARDAAPVPLAKLGQPHEEQPVLLLCPRDAFSPLLCANLSLLPVSNARWGRERPGGGVTNYIRY